MNFCLSRTILYILSGKTRNHLEPKKKKEKKTVNKLSLSLQKCLFFRVSLQILCEDWMAWLLELPGEATARDMLVIVKVITSFLFFPSCHSKCSR